MADQMIMNVEQMARAMNGLDDDEMPTKSQRNRVSELCRKGKLDAVKAGRRWLIRIEWPDANDGKAQAMEDKAMRVTPRTHGKWKVPRTI